MPYPKRTSPYQRPNAMTRSTQLRTTAVAITSCALLLTFGCRKDSSSGDSKDRVQLASVAKRIDAHATKNGKAWPRLKQLCEGIGHRIAGSASLERAIDWAAEQLRADGHENVAKEKVMVPKWVRGNESLTMLAPQRRELAVLGLGGSVGTPTAGIEGEVVVVNDEGQLEKLGAKAQGTIVLFNKKMPPFDPVRGNGYGELIKQRLHSARLAAKHGAVAALIRSITAANPSPPHTGSMSYGDAKVRIPAAAISPQRADEIARLIDAGTKVRVRLQMQARNEGMVPSANVVAELRGRSKPDEIVLIGAHIDTWDVGQGAHDDGAGCVMVMEALTCLRQLGLVPRRTIRLVLFTSEENGAVGAKGYKKRHAAELNNHVAAIESDIGAFRTHGFSVENWNEEAKTRMVNKLRPIAKSLSFIDADKIQPGFSGVDILVALRKTDAALLGHWVDGSRYFDYHHSTEDTIDKVSPQDLSRGVVAIAFMAYALAEMPDRM